MTTQIEDKLEIDGKSCGMQTMIHLPTMHPRIWTALETVFNPIDGSRENRPRPSLSSSRSTRPVDGIYSSTACYRGYQGTWEIRKKFLYLKRLEGIEAEMIGDEPILADWFTGTLNVGRGKNLDFRPWTYEKTQIITIEVGRIVSMNLVENPEWRRWDDLGTNRETPDGAGGTIQKH